jgi:hypothetical protein
MPRELWTELDGVEERFDAPGGGFLNLDTYRRDKPPLGRSFDRALWSLSPPVRPCDPLIAALTDLAHREFRAGRYEACAAVARLARARAPDEPEPQGYWPLSAIGCCKWRLWWSWRSFTGRWQTRINSLAKTKPPVVNDIFTRISREPTEGSHSRFAP